MKQKSTRINEFMQLYKDLSHLNILVPIFRYKA